MEKCFSCFHDKEKECGSELQYKTDLLMFSFGQTCALSNSFY